MALLDSPLAPASGANIPLFSNVRESPQATLRQRPQIGLVVGEHRGSLRGPGRYQARGGRHLAVEVQFGIAAAVEADGGPHFPVDQVEADQLALFHAAADDELVPPVTWPTYSILCSYWSDQKV